MTSPANNGLRAPLWWSYFAFVLWFYSVALFDAATADKGLFPFVYLFVGVWGLVGLCGFILRIPIGSRLLWVACFLLFLAQVSFLLFLPLLARGATAVMPLLAGGALFIAPQLYALYRYAFQSPSIWASHAFRA